MRIVSWNCCWQKEGFTDEKRNEILKLNPDILIVQECKQDDWLKLGYTDKIGHWYGDGKESRGDPNKNLGIGIYCDKKYTIDCSLFKNQDLSNMRYAIPYIIKYQDKEILTIFSVWAKSGYEYYHVPILNSLEYFNKKINSPIILIGDFNTGSQYNNKTTGQFYEFIKNELKTKFFLENCAFWQEWLPTFHVKKDGKYEFYLDDHCFSEIRSEVLSFGMGNFFQWSEFSDHVPLIIDFDNKTVENYQVCQLLHWMYTSDEWKQTGKELREEMAGHYSIPTYRYGDYIKE
jgi:exonuclease III